MNKIFSKKIELKNVWIGLSIVIAVLSLFHVIWPIAFAVHDDLRTYLEVKTGTMISTTDQMARAQGRFYFWFSAIFCYFPYLFDSLIAVKIISYLTLLFDGSALYFFVKRLSGKSAGWIAVLLFFAFGQLQHSFQHNLFVSYIFCHQGAIGILLIALERFLAFQESKKNRDLHISALLLLFATMLYEAFLLFSAMFFIITVFYHIKDKKWDIKGTFYVLRWHIFWMSLFLLAYLVWGYIYPSTYSGAMIGKVTFSQVIKAIFIYGTGYFPLRTAFDAWLQAGIRDSFSWFALIKGFIIAGGFVLLVVKREKIKNKGKVFVIGVVGTFLPVSMHALTAKYVGWLDQGIYSYLPSFYSYFFIICAILSIGYFLYEKIPFKKIFLAICFVGVLGITYVTQIGNQQQVGPYVQNLEKYKAFDAIVSTDEFLEVEEEAQIYAPDYMGVHGDMNSLSRYANTYTGKNYRFVNLKQDINWDEAVYYLDYMPEEKGIFFGKMEEDGRVLESFHLLLDDASEPMETFFSYGEGFYAIEDPTNGRCWSQKESELYLRNYSEKPQQLTVRFSAYTLSQEENPEMTIKYKDNTWKVPLNDQWQEIQISLELEPGQEPVTFQCDFEPLQAEDGRSLAFSVEGIELK